MVLLLDTSYALAIERDNEVVRIAAKSLAFETNIEEESSNKIEIINEKIELALRRKKRRKRRRCYSECLDMDKGTLYVH